jgi:ADP-heptose:LPS heptosyltransferase
MKILISPHSKPMRNGKSHPKVYPWWQELVDMMTEQGHEITQIGRHEEKVYVTKFLPNLSFEEIEALVRQQDLWISVDNFLPHLCNAEKVMTKGIVIFGRSDPKIYGYFQNTNILKDRKYLRPDQFHIWEQCEYDEESFLKPKELMAVIQSVINQIKL